MTENEAIQLAEARIENMGFSQADMKFIWADWPNMTDHIEWLLTATRQEIASWINASK